MSLTSKEFKGAYPPEVVLAEMLGKKFGTLGFSPDPEQLKAWLTKNWGVLSVLAHAIHHQHAVEMDASYTERYLAKLGQR